MKTDGLARLLKFLAHLQSSNINYRIDHNAPESLTVAFALVGARVEVDFDAEMMHFSVFRGDEAVNTNVEELTALIAKDLN
jgi:hypothetical protein